MAGNTIMTAKNSFQEGLVMDISPENMNANSLTSALNATLLTYNGNEMSLQNDMGNGRVETAFLPEGFIPIGTCEFGDIIYIVSYNPLIDKAQIGCFPSPERNISSDETNKSNASLSASDFQKLDDNNEPTGELKANSVKKIIYQNDKLHPGDQYIIAYSGDVTYVTDYKTTQQTLGSLPKFLKIKVVAIDDTGKITELSNNVKWYDLPDNKYFFMKPDKNSDNEPIDIDTYRSIVSSAYNTFSSKISGKLALLIELEKIDGFSCSWEAIAFQPNEIVNSESNKDLINYNIYLNYNWHSQDLNVNPKYVLIENPKWKYNGDENIENYTTEYEQQYLQITETIITKEYEITRLYKPEELEESEESNELYTEYIENKTLPEKIKQSYTNGKYDIGKYVNNNQIYNMEDDVVNNYYNLPLKQLLGTFNIPKGFPVSLTYTATPAMPYGKLSEYAVTNTIHFDKLGTTSIDLNQWRYYQYEDLLTLTWGLEAYTEPGKKIEKVIFEFYDNIGIAATSIIDNYTSYNGQFTSYITLNKNTLKNTDSEGTSYEHAASPNYGRDITDDQWSKEKYYTIEKIEGIDETETQAKIKQAKSIYYYTEANTKANETSKNPGTIYYKDDAGTLQSGLLYLTKIIVRMVDEHDNSIHRDEVFYRWLWTNGQYNDQYYLEKDFSNLQFTVNLDCDAYYNSNGTELNIDPNSFLSITDETDYETTVSYLRQSIEDCNLTVTPRVYLSNEYNNIYLDQSELKNLAIDVILANNTKQRFPEEPRVQYYKNEIYAGRKILDSDMGSLTVKFEDKSELSSDIKINTTNENNIIELWL